MLQVITEGSVVRHFAMTLDMQRIQIIFVMTQRTRVHFHENGHSCREGQDINLTQCNCQLLQSAQTLLRKEIIWELHHFMVTDDSLF